MCSIDESNRKDCGYVGINQTQCEIHCCWQVLWVHVFIIGFCVCVLCFLFFLLFFCEKKTKYACEISIQSEYIPLFPVLFFIFCRLSICMHK